jgi:hypothetical protein
MRTVHGNIRTSKGELVNFHGKATQQSEGFDRHRLGILALC